MSLVRDTKRKTYSANIKHRVFGRVHLALKTKEKAVAMRRHAALTLLLDAGEPVRDLVGRLRHQLMTIQSVEECVRSKLPFSALRASVWPSLSVAVQEYQDARENAPSTTRSNTQTAFNHALAFFGNQRTLESITHDEVSAYRTTLLAKGLNPNTVSVYLSVFGALYGFLQGRETRRAVQQKRAPSMLFSPLDRTAHVTAFVPSRLRFLARVEAERILAAAPASLAPMIALGLFAGLRGGEVMQLRNGVDVDLAGGMLHIQSRPGWQPKYGKHRDIPISAVLRPYLESVVQNEGYLFPSLRNPKQPLDLKFFERHFARVVTDAELIAGRKDPNGITVHTLRHTFASWLVMAGADLFTIAKLMGHSGIRQVEQTYAHLSPEHRRRTVELLSAEWTKATTKDQTETSYVA